MIFLMSIRPKINVSFKIIYNKIEEMSFNTYTKNASVSNRYILNNNKL